MERQELDDTIRKIRDWLTIELNFRCEIPVDSAHSHFQIEFPSGSGRLVDVIFPKPREDILLIVSATALSKVYYDALKAMSVKKRRDILWDMRFKLLFKGSEFQMIPSPEDLQRIQFIRPLRFDGLTQNLLMDAIREDFRCHLFIEWTMMRLFGDGLPKSSDTMYG